MNSEKLTAKNRAYLLAPVVLPYPKRVNFNYSLLTINHSLLFHARITRSGNHPQRHSPHLEGRILKGVTVRESRLRWPVSDGLYGLKDCPVIALRRRAKYLLIELEAGQVMIHLGMSGTLRVVEAALPLRKHDHVDLLLDSGKVLRFNDPRRFGSVLYQPGGEPHSLLAALGPEPLGRVSMVTGFLPARGVARWR